MCLLFEILVPPVFNLKLIGLPFNIRIFYALVYGIMVYKMRIKGVKIDHSIFYPFGYLLSSLFVLSFFQGNTPIQYQIFSLLRILIVVYLLPVMIWNVTRLDPQAIIHIKDMLCIYMLIACLYGLFLTMIPGINPYLILLYDTYTIDGFDISYSAALDEGRLFGRIQSTFVHPMTWSLFLCFSFVLLYVFHEKTKKKLYLPLLLLVFVNIIVCGVRTGIVVSVICLIINSIQRKKIKSLIYLGLLVGLCFLIVISVNNDAYNYLFSIVDFHGKSSQVSGSSLSMRFEQLAGCFDIINSNPLFGNGFGWNTYYMSANGDHPVLLAFESLIYVILCNSGIIGCFLWVYFFRMLLIKKAFVDFKERSYIQMLIFAYIGFSILTGEYDYLQQFAIYYSILYSYLKINKN